MNGSNSIQVVKGSDAVRYGSEALGGIIIMEQAALPFRTKSLKGKGAMLYGSNGRRFVLTGQMEGAFPFLRDIAWRVQGTCSNSGDRSTANYLLNNTVPHRILSPPGWNCYRSCPLPEHDRPPIAALSGGYHC